MTGKVLAASKRTEFVMLKASALNGGSCLGQRAADDDEGDHQRDDTHNKISPRRARKKRRPLHGLLLSRTRLQGVDNLEETRHACRRRLRREQLPQVHAD